jgi:hypothetical protein
MEVRPDEQQGARYDARVIAEEQSSKGRDGGEAEQERIPAAPGL